MRVFRGRVVLVAAAAGLWLAAPPQAEAVKWKREKVNPVLRAEQVPAPPSAYYPLIGDPDVLFDDGIYKMWFSYGGLDQIEDPDSVTMRTGYAQSADGRKWTVSGEPALDIGAGWDRTNAEAPCVVKDAALPDGDPRKYRMYYTGMTQPDPAAEEDDEELETGMVSGIGLAFSADGRLFTRLPAAESPSGEEGLVLAPNPVAVDQQHWDFLQIGDPFVLHQGGRYHMWYTSAGHRPGTEEAYFSIGYATSSDGIKWFKQGQVLLADQPWETAGGPGIGRPSVLWTGERFEMFYDAVKADDNPAQNTSEGIGFAWSDDGKMWKKSEGPVFTWKKAKGEKSGMLTGTAALSHEGGYRLYYGTADADWDHLGINLVTGSLELD